MTGVEVLLPTPNNPIVDPETGMPTRQEVRFRDSLWKRTGGASDIIQGVIDGATASGLFQAVAGSTSAGAQATIVLEVRAGTGEAFRNASIKLSALPGSASRIELAATTITIDGTLLSNGAILSSHIGSGQVATGNLAASAVTTATIATGAVTTGTIASNAVTTATIASSAVTTATIASDAACAHGKEDFSGITSQANTNYHSLNTGLVMPLTGAVTELDLNLIVHNSDGGDHSIQVQLVKDGSILKAWPASGTEGFTAQHTGYTSFHFTWHDSDTGNHTYLAQWANPGATTTLTAEGTLRIDEIKR